MSVANKEISKNQKRYITLFPALILVFLLIFIYSLNIGFTPITFDRIVQTIFGNGTREENIVLFLVRLPSVVVATIVGICLTMSGAVMQGATRNPLATPSMLGVTSGSSFAVLIALFGYENNLLPLLSIPLVAVAGGMITFSIVYRLSLKHDLSPPKLILNGIAINSCINAMSLIFTVRLSPSSYTNLNTIMAGSLTYATWDKILLTTILMLPLAGYIIYKAIYLNVLNLSEEIAIGLGIELKKERKKLMYVTVVLTSISAYIAGGIGSIGLIAPHIARRLVGPNFKYLIPIASIIGILLIVISDLVSRLFFDSAVPVGMILSVLGSPYLLYLLFTTDR